jgi:hypothetical protein
LNEKLTLSETERIKYLNSWNKCESKNKIYKTAALSGWGVVLLIIIYEVLK